jgi:organic radical activating enzyme
MRQQFLSGEKPAGCERCWTEEAAGKESCRVRHLAMYPQDLSLVHSEKYLEGPSTIVFQSTNVCNFACRTCRAQHTGLYKEEGQFYASEYGEKSRWYIREDSNSHINQDELLQFAQISKNLKKVDFFGGEPLLNTTHWTFLKELINRGQSRDISLYYNTNGSIYPPPELIELWSQFKKVQLGLSIDGIHEQYPYLRYPGDWDRLTENVRRFKHELPSMLGQAEHEMLTILTVSSLNIYYLPEIYSWNCSEVGPYCYIGLAHEPDYYSPRNLPAEVKEKVAEKLRLSKVNNAFDDIVKFMLTNEVDEKSMKKFFVWTERKDRYRNQRFAQVFPEYFEILKPYHAQHSQDLTQ